MFQQQVRSEVFLREDIESVLRAIDAANSQLAGRFASAQADEFRAGFRAALEAVALAFHSTLDEAREAQIVDVEAVCSLSLATGVALRPYGATRP